MGTIGMGELEACNPGLLDPSTSHPPPALGLSDSFTAKIDTIDLTGDEASTKDALQDNRRKRAFEAEEVSPRKAAPVFSRAKSSPGKFGETSSRDGPSAFTINADIVEEARLYSAKPYRPYWSYKFYRGPRGQKVNVRYAKTKEESETIARDFLNHTVLGFDMEWRSRYKAGIKSNISLIQLASEDMIGLFHIALHKGTTTAQLLAPSLRKILESPVIAKCGVACLNADGKRLKNFMSLKPAGMFELSYLYRVTKYANKQPELVTKKLVGLADHVNERLGYPMFKGAVRTSDWTKPLTEKQIEYSASDAYAGIMLYVTMEYERLKMVPVPPRPAFAELGLPLLATEQPPESNEDALLTDDIPVVHDLEESANTSMPIGVGTRELASAADEHIEPAVFGERTQERNSTATASSTYKGFPKPNGLGRQTTALPKPSSVPFQTASVPVQQDLRAVTISFHAESSLKELNRQSKQILSALKALRIQLANKSKVTREDIASDATLVFLALQCPRTEQALGRVLDCNNLREFSKKHGVDLLAFMRKHTPP